MNDEQQIIEPVPTMAGYKKIPTFKLWIANQFPYIETDFDAITNYELLQAVIKYLNTIIENENNVESNVTALYNAFVNLHDYVEEQFDSLNLQDEVNTKIDEMYESGLFDNLLNNYLNLTKVFDTYNDMMLDTSTYVNGMKLKTLGYHYINDGGGAEYIVTNVQNDNKYQISIGTNLWVELIVKDDILNVKQIGAKSNDNTFDNKEVIDKALDFINIYTLYFPEGEYITSSIGEHNITNDIEICGKNARLKLKDNSVTADFKYMFRLKVNDNINTNITIHDLTINMNRTNNHSVIDSSGNSYALQHCHAICVFPQNNGVGKINVNYHDLNFEDLIADGLSFASNGTGHFESIVINNVVSQDRQGTRSDICVTGDFQNLLVTNCDLDKLEIEINSLNPNITKRNVNISNCVTRQAMDLDITGSTTDIINVSNCNIYGWLYWDSNIAKFDNCYIENRVQRINPTGNKAYFNNCTFRAGDTISSKSYFFIPDTKRLSLIFNNCDIMYTYENLTYFIEAYIIPELVFNNCNINIYNALIDFRGGNIVNFNNNIINSSAENPTNTVFIAFHSFQLASTTKLYLTQNKSTSSVGLCLMPTTNPNASTLEVYEDNPAWPMGKVLRFNRYDKITAFNGGTGAIVTIRKSTNYDSDVVPTSGYWIIGQFIKKTTTNTTSVGWLCTKNGNFEEGSITPTFREITI